MAESVCAYSWSGSGLQRPECVLATASGNLYVSDWRGGVTQVAPDGQQHSYLAGPVDGVALRPNGIALRRDGSFLLAHLGAETGGVYHLQRDGTARPLLRRVDGVDLPPTNFVLEDAQDRLWITVSTRRRPRSQGYRAQEGDGFIVMLDRRGARVVADGLGYTNECLVDDSTGHLYVNETFARRLSRFRIRADGSLCERETVTIFGPGTFPDGLVQDETGDLWVTSIVSNRVIRVGQDGAQTLHLQDCDPLALQAVEQAYVASRMDREHLDTPYGKVLKNISSLAFGGPDRTTGYLGCLLGDAIASIRMPVAGKAPLHWNYG